MEILQELRKAGHAGRRSIILIGMTPTIRSQWAPVKEDYGDGPRSTLRRVDQDRAECRWSLGEVAPWVLSEPEKAKLRRQYERDPLANAREHGDYMDASGSCPFDLPTLELLMEETREPKRIVRWRVQREIDTETGRARTLVEVPVQVWRDPEPRVHYYIPEDPSTGVRYGRNDPAGLLVTRAGSGDLDARYNGYDGAYALGVLGSGLARQYNSAVCDPETQGGWGESTLRGHADAGYGNIAHERYEVEPGKWATRLGFRTTDTTRSAMIGAIQEWVDARRAGIRYAVCPSRDVIQTLMDMMLDENGKAVKAPGYHIEDAILLGQSLRRNIRNRGVAIPTVKPPPRDPDAGLLDEIRGHERNGNRPAPSHQNVGRARKRPRA